MNYTITHASLTGPSYGSTARVGIEIQPPLSVEASQGLVEELTTPDIGQNDGPAAIAARLTRQDEKGTAFVITPNNAAFSSPQVIARRIGALIDPCKLHHVSYVASEA
jgi:hypothetical protein